MIEIGPNLASFLEGLAWAVVGLLFVWVAFR